MKNRQLLNTFLSLFLSCIAKSQTISTIVGGYNGDGKKALDIAIFPGNQIVDNSGNIYFVESIRHQVRKLSASGIYSTVAGNGKAGFDGDGGPATAACLNGPRDIALDDAGNLYIADENNHRVRKVSPDGIISTFAGTGAAGFSGDSAQATSALLRNPSAVAADKFGNIFIADRLNYRVRKVTTDGTITTIAGTGVANYTGSGQAAIVTSIAPVGITLNKNGELYISEADFNIIRKIGLDGHITLVAGTGTKGFNGDGGLATNAQISVKNRVGVDTNGNVYIADPDVRRIRKVDVSGKIATIAGNWTEDESGENVPANTATFLSAAYVAVDQTGNVFVSSNNVIRKIGLNGIINTIAGNNLHGSGDGGNLDSAQVYLPESLLTDSTGNIYFVQSENHYVRRIADTGIIAAFAGIPHSGGVVYYGGDGGEATNALMHSPVATAIDPKGNVLITEYARVRKVSKNGIITTVIGHGNSGHSGDGGAATDALVDSWMDGIAVDSAGNIFIAEIFNAYIRKIDATGIITTIAGNGITGHSGDGLPAKDAQLQYPGRIKTDKAGNLYFLENSRRIRKIAADGIISTIAGNGTTTYAGDGILAVNSGMRALDFALDDYGNIFLADYSGGRILKVDALGIISTFAGGGTDDGENVNVLNARIGSPYALTFDRSGDLLFTNAGFRIRKIKMKVTNVWTGEVSNAWENPANWSRHKLPDEYADVVINAGTVDVSSNVSIRSLKLNPGVNFRINAGYSLNILH